MFLYQDFTQLHVGVFTRKNLKGEAEICTEVSSKVKFLEEIFENITVKIPGLIPAKNGSSKKDLIISAVYRQPNNNELEKFKAELGKLLTIVDKSKNELIIAGDFNLDLLKYDHHQPTADYLDQITTHGLLPRIVRPTRIKEQSATLIDHIFTRDNGQNIMCGIIDTEIAGNSGYTGHFPTFLILETGMTKKEEKGNL